MGINGRCMSCICRSRLRRSLNPKARIGCTHLHTQAWQLPRKNDRTGQANHPPGQQRSRGTDTVSEHTGNHATEWHQTQKSRRLQAHDTTALVIIDNRLQDHIDRH